MGKSPAMLLALSLCAAPLAGPLRAQAPIAVAELPFEEVPLDDLSAFRSPGANWQVAGRIEPGRLCDELVPVAGTGVLANVPRPEAASDLFSAWEHGDIELELEFLVPRGSNSGVYLQGRYEVQIFDSWGVRSPTFADAGGIYQRWDESRPEGRYGFEGHAARVNASRAPGLWQTLHIVFQAPRFDDAGNKVANARFVRVVHNGTVVHENVDVTGPTRASPFEDERPLAPLMLQGDHGPVAFRNIRYKRYDGEPLRLVDLRYRAFHGEFESLDEAAGGEVVREGRATGLTSAVAGATDEFALDYEGTLSVATAGRYLFELGFDWVTDDPQFAGVVVGGGRLVIGDQEVLVHDGLVPSATGEVDLGAGEHPFSLFYFKKRPWISDWVGVSLMAEGTHVERHALHEVGAPAAPPPGLIGVDASAEPVVQRGFVRHAERTWTRAVSIGDPQGVHYAYDLGQGTLLYAWRGPFIETTDMWHDRGYEQLALPRGSVLPIADSPSLATLVDDNQPWPDSLHEEDGYTLRGYSLDEAGRPAFHYQLRGFEVDERIRPAHDGRALRRELRLRGPDDGGALYLRVAHGEAIRHLEDGSYAVGDLRYYVTLEPDAPAPVLRSVAGGEELLLPVGSVDGARTLAYTIFW